MCGIYRRAYVAASIFSMLILMRQKKINPHTYAHNFSAKRSKQVRY